MTLVLSANNFAELADLDVLGTFPMLTHLVLMDNPVARKEVCSSGWVGVGKALMGAALPMLDSMEMS